jgi:hypothetical protein
MEPIANAEIQERIREALISCALEEDSLKESRREEKLCMRDTLEVLEEITSLDREELETLAHKARRSYDGKQDTFFSLKHQILLASVFVGFILGMPILGIWLF